MKTNEIRFLRTRYLDPTTGKDDWKPIQLGQNQTPLTMGFFGEPLMVAGSPFPGTAPMGGSGIAGAMPVGNGFGSSGSGGSVFGSSNNSSIGSDSSGASTGANSPAGADAGGDSDSASGTNPTGQTFGGGAIIGFSPASPKQSI